MNQSTDYEKLWTVVSTRKKKFNIEESINKDQDTNATDAADSESESNPVDKISEPCWFFNNGGCHNKDGSIKPADECKYLHIYSENVKRPPHLGTKKPCDKLNLEGVCKWGDNCKYSHRTLSLEEWNKYYEGIPYTVKSTLQHKVVLETKVDDVEERIKVMEFKQDGISKDIQYIGQGVQKCLRSIQLLSDKLFAIAK